MKAKTTIELSPEQIREIFCKALGKPDAVVRFNIGSHYYHPMDRDSTPIVKSATVSFETEVEV